MRQRFEHTKTGPDYKTVDRMSNDGWELVSATHAVSGMFSEITLWWKRPKAGPVTRPVG